MINSEAKCNEKEGGKTKKRVYNDNGGDGFINPSIFFEQVANNQAKTENGDEQRQGDDLGVVAADVFDSLEQSHFKYSATATANPFSLYTNALTRNERDFAAQWSRVR